MWFFRHFWIFISYHIFLLNQVEGAIAIPPSNSAPLPLFCPSVCLSVCPSIGLLTTFSGFCTFADKSLGRNGIELEMQMFPDDLPLANIDADGYCCHFMRSSVRPTIHGLGFVYCIQSAWKKWPTIWHADVSRWLTLSIHGCLWILLLVCLSVHLSVCSFTAFSGGCAFFFLRLGLGQRRAVVIIGRWLLPSLVDTGDICCHYWQLILVKICSQRGIKYKYVFDPRPDLKWINVEQDLYCYIASLVDNEWTHLLSDKMAAISPTIFSDPLSRMKYFVFWLKISLKFVPKGPIINNGALVYIMA